MFKKTSFIIILTTFIVGEEAVSMQQEARGSVYRNEKFGYTVSYPDHWFPSRLQYANEFEIRNYVVEDPQVSARNRALVRIVDKVNESAEVTDRYLDSLVARQNTPKQEHQTLGIDGHRAVRVRGKLAYPTGSSIDTPTFYLAISTYIADEKHMVSLEASAPVDVDESVIQEIIKIEESVKFDKGR
jgi:D-alanine-D-alanine ligase-like ATP-grasp enzyme